MKTRISLLVCLVALAAVALAEEGAADKKSPTELRLLNTAVFGKPATEPVVLLEPPALEAVDPVTVMVDISNGEYFAATVSYPLDIGFGNARKSLNKAYGKWESESFADDPAMGIWRNEDDQFSVQLSQDGFNINVIYIKYAMLTDEKINESFSKLDKLRDDESNARQAIGAMHALLSKKDFATFYSTQCHRQFRKETGEPEFVAFMQSDRGQEVSRLVAAINAAINDGADQDTLLSRFNPRDSWEYEFVLAQDNQEAQTKRPRHIQLRKEAGTWKLKSYN